MRDFLNRRFHLAERGTHIATEGRAGVTTFLTMAYILFVNPGILKAAGVPFGGAVVATAVGAGVASLLMGLGANFPLALAPGMGLNAVIAYSVILGQGVSWQVGMGLVFWDGVIVLLLVLVGLREAVLRAIPMDLKRAIGGGIGLFIALIGLVNARLVTVNPATFKVLKSLPEGATWPTLPPVSFGDVTAPGALVTVLGLLFTGFLLARRVKGALLLGIGFSTVVALPLGVAHLPSGLTPPDFSTFGQLDPGGALRLSLLPLLLGILLVDFFDTMGTVTAIGEQGGLTDEQGNVPGLGRILAVDSLAAAIGGVCGCSSITSYIESAAGVAEGGRTGLSSVVVGLIFLLSLFLAPLAGIVPSEATAPALIIIGLLMMATVAKIDFGRVETALPAFVTLLATPLTYSISRGIGYGFILYVALLLLRGRARELHPLMVVVALIFALSFALLPTV